MFKFISLSLASLFVASTLGANSTVMPPMPPGYDGDVSSGIVLELKKGWNALTVPFDGTIDSSIFEGVAEKSSSSGKPVIWVMNSDGSNYAGMGGGISITAGTGFWVKTNMDTTVRVSNTNPTDGFSFSSKWSSTTTYGDTWKFMGVSTDTKFSDILAVGVKTFWPYKGSYTIGYDSETYYGGLSAESTITAGTGFWIKDK